MSVYQVAFSKVVYVCLMIMCLVALASTIASSAEVECPTFPVTVMSETELNAAIVCYNAQTIPGTYEILLSGDILLTTSTTQINNASSSVNLLITGAGFKVDAQVPAPLCNRLLSRPSAAAHTLWVGASPFSTAPLQTMEPELEEVESTLPLAASR